LTDFQTFFVFFHVFQVVKHTPDSFRTILWSTNHVLKKVGRGRDHDLFIFWYFRNLHALRYPKSVTGFFCEHFWVYKSLSMMCSPRPLCTVTSSSTRQLKIRHWKDIYQRIFISHILSKNREKGIPLSFFWVGYVEGYNILILGIYKFLYPILSSILFRKKWQFWGTFAFAFFFDKYRNKLGISSFKLRI
jgi:hypothetical protein